MSSLNPNLEALRAFTLVARLGSFVAAADAMHVTHGAISKKITALERALGTSLFERRNRGVHLTARGRWLAQRLTPVFDDLDAAMREFRQATGDDPLTVSCEPTLCLRFLIPLVAELKRDTGLDIRVVAGGGEVDFLRGKIDLAIRRNDFAMESGVEAVRLAAEWMGPVVNPDLSASMASAPRLSSATRRNAWPDWCRTAETRMAGPVVEYEHFYQALQAAESGQGAAMASVHMVAADLAIGRLTAPLGFHADGTSYVALRRQGAPDYRTDRLIEWLVTRMQRNETAWTI